MLNHFYSFFLNFECSKSILITKLIPKFCVNCTALDVISMLSPKIEMYGNLILNHSKLGVSDTNHEQTNFNEMRELSNEHNNDQRCVWARSMAK